MSSSWRVACVRIPRFPIGAGWRAARVVPGSPEATATPMPSAATPSMPSLGVASASPATTCTELTFRDIQLDLLLDSTSRETGSAATAPETAPATGTARATMSGSSTAAPATGPRTGGAGARPNPGSAGAGDAISRGNAPGRSSRAGAASRLPAKTGETLPPPPRHWDDLPRALTDGARLRVVSLAAGRAGVRAGMTVAEAKARCAELDVRPWDDHAIDDAILAATTALLAASPQVTPATGTPGMWWVGATGFDALGGEAQLAHTLLTIARQWHPDARVAIADSCVAARAATWAPVPQEVTLIPHQGCARYLAPAPLGLVPMPDELRDALRMLGLTTVGALAALSAGDVEQRWGAEGLGAWRLAHGDDARRPGLVRVDAVRSASVELPGAVESAEPILFVLRAQLQRLLHQCVHDGRAAAAVAITLVLDAGQQYPIEDIGSELRGHVHVPETSDDSEQEAGSRKRRSDQHHTKHPTPASYLPLGPTPSPQLPPPASHRGPRSVPAASALSLLGVPQRTITREVRPARPLARLEPLFDQCRALLERFLAWRP